MRLFVLTCVYPYTCCILLIQTACSCSSTVTSVLYPASPQWNFLYKDTSLCSPINQAADVHSLWCSVCVCVSPKDSPRDEHGAPWCSLWTASQEQGHIKEGDVKVEPSAGRRGREGRQRAGQRVRQAGGGHGATEQQIHWTEGSQRVPYKDSGVGMESRQLSALLSKSSTAEVPESQWLNMVQRQCSNKQGCFFTCRRRLQRNGSHVSTAWKGDRSVAAVLPRLHQHGTVPLAVREKDNFHIISWEVLQCVARKRGAL